ncbi:hypothetical protein AAG906_033046 [Vitis piasezkii]
MSTPLASSKPSYRKESKEGKAKRIGQGRGGNGGKCVEGTYGEFQELQECHFQDDASIPHVILWVPVAPSPTK